MPHHSLDETVCRTEINDHPDFIFSPPIADQDEADVLGDRIAIVKDGRMRALGSSKFLKQRFGLGYLLRMSLSEGALVAPIEELVKAHVSETTLSSNAGTELSMRMPKEAVVQFPSLFESIEQRMQQLGIISYGIETTTLEEVFMRVINEDTQLLLSDHAEANRLIGASQEERAQYEQSREDREKKVSPLPEEDFTALLNKGNNKYALRILTFYFNFSHFHTKYSDS